MFDFLIHDKAKEVKQRLVKECRMQGKKAEA